MRTKWASCSTAGSLQFSTDPLNLDRQVGDYVIVHELLHFSVPNHGKLWKSLMRAHLGDYERLESKLKRAAMRQERTRGHSRVVDSVGASAPGDKPAMNFRSGRIVYRQRGALRSGLEEAAQK